jgi:hypothetical protein
MIQRIQTVWLFLVALLNASLVFLPMVRNATGAVLPNAWVLKGAAGLVVLLAVATIFFYKRRPLQIRCCCGLLLLTVAGYASFFLLIPGAAGAAILSTAWNFPIFFPLVSLVPDVLAIRAIQKDERLVRSLDRIR